MKKDKKQPTNKDTPLRNFAMSGKNTAAKMIKKLSGKKGSRGC